MNMPIMHPDYPAVQILPAVFHVLVLTLIHHLIVSLKLIDINGKVIENLIENQSKKEGEYNMLDQHGKIYSRCVLPYTDNRE